MAMHSRIFILLLGATLPSVTSAYDRVARQDSSICSTICQPAPLTSSTPCGSLPATTSPAYASTSSAPQPGETLSNGGYVCNPAHPYPGATCNGQNSPPTLSYYPTTPCSNTPVPTTTTSCGTPLVPTTMMTKVSQSFTQTFQPVASFPIPSQSPQPPVASTTASQAAAPPSTLPSSPSAPPASSSQSSAPPPSPSPPTIGQQPPTSASMSSQSPAPPSSAPSPSQPAQPPASPSTSPVGNQCPVSLTEREYQFPHLIVISNDNKKTSSTLYFATVSSSVTSYFNFDIPSRYAGRTCDVVFGLPRQDQLETSSFTLSGNGGQLSFGQLSQPAAQNADLPNIASQIAMWVPTPGSSYTVASGPCTAGKTIGFSIGATQGTSLRYFQDYNPCPIGLYVVAR